MQRERERERERECPDPEALIESQHAPLEFSRKVVIWLSRPYPVYSACRMVWFYLTYILCTAVAVWHLPLIIRLTALAVWPEPLYCLQRLLCGFASVLCQCTYYDVRRLPCGLCPCPVYGACYVAFAPALFTALAVWFCFYLLYSGCGVLCPYPV